MSSAAAQRQYKSRTLQPHQSSQDGDVIGPHGRKWRTRHRFRMLDHIPEQFEDINTVRVDDRSVVTFEVPRTAGTLPSKSSVFLRLLNTVTN